MKSNNLNLIMPKLKREETLDQIIDIDLYNLIIDDIKKNFLYYENSQNILFRGRTDNTIQENSWKMAGSEQGVIFYDMGSYKKDKDGKPILIGRNNIRNHFSMHFSNDKIDTIHYKNYDVESVPFKLTYMI